MSEHRRAPVVTVLRNAATAQIFRELPENYDIAFAGTEDARDRQRLRRTEILVVALTRVDAALLDLMPKLRLVQNFGVGLDMLDLETLRSRGIQVANTRGYNADVVAEHAMMLLLVLSRGFVKPYLDLKQRGEWRGSGPWSWELKGKRMGIIGYGEVGKALARKARCFDMTVQVWNRAGAARSSRDGIVLQPLSELLASTDALCITAPLTAQTRGLIGRDALERMRPEAVLVNVGRGAIVDQNALIEAVRGRRLRGAGLDVTDPEPLPPDHALLSVDNIVVTPHCAGASADTRARGRAMVYDNIERFARGEPVLNRVEPAN